ncbi:MAG TPA: M14 family zinc carboxypeptidase, partial [Flavisolibacter sp.]|nr:M14 family zinc carboxypeptidase [Flavisolibacter sp.]
MVRRIAVVVFFLFVASFSFAQLKSPEEFLGYKIGTKLTPHWKIVDYFKSVAKAVPSMVKLEPYGQTNEGRPLMVAYISSDVNISNLENLRRHNMFLAKQGNDAGSNYDYPAIVWLSYNVHGNEASSSEAAMFTLYALVDPKNSQTKQWLRNTLVIIDPCINPDGRDRHVN